jgi:hypothetical protein
MTSLPDRKCLECAIPFKGRSDKKFCSDPCRTSYNNRLHQCSDVIVKNVNNILKRNRRILTALNPDGRRKVAVEKLMTLGFNFNYFTNTVTTKGGMQYYYCYDLGYMPIEKENCLLIVRKELNHLI